MDPLVEAALSKKLLKMEILGGCALTGSAMNVGTNSIK